MELLVHNVSHSDMVLSLEPLEPLPVLVEADDGEENKEPQEEEDPYILCRPRFSCFSKYSQAVLDHLGDDEILSFPRYERQLQGRLVRATAKLVPTGLKLKQPAPVDVTQVRVRGRNQNQVACADAWQIRHVFFPLLATLMPCWQQQIERTDAKRVLLLVSGVGTPRNWTHDPQGNSTRACAQLMQHFLRLIDPTLTVVLVHSDDHGIFRYDSNLRFVHDLLMPTIHAYRDAHAQGLPYPDEPRDGSVASEFDTHWRESFHTTLSFADGSPARIHAIQASLRPYRPTYFHVWQIKTFWHESKIVLDDVEAHSFEEMEQNPAVDVEQVGELEQRVISEMKAFAQQMRETLQSDHDLLSFWLRKTHKPVLAVLLVQTARGIRTYRGTNMEVSMPTGSLCAERNVIGSALADNPSLKRSDLKLMAVLAIPLEENFRLPVNRTSLTDMATVDGKGSLGSEAEEWVVPNSASAHPSEASLTEAADTSFDVVDAPSTTGGNEGTAAPAVENTDTSMPLRRISLFSRGNKRTVMIHSRSKDLNPLSPCGACNEWLKKISESNPYFKMLTFTDSQCTGVYITPCQE
jgi:cytidine deaminase